MYNNTCDGDLVLPISTKAINSVSKKTLSDIVKRVRTHDLPKRAFTINSNTVSVPKFESVTDPNKKQLNIK